MHLSKYSLKSLSLLTFRYSRTVVIIIASVLVSAVALSAALYNIKPVHAATTPEFCFATTGTTTKTITNYYNHEGNNSANPACPRDVVIPEMIGGAPVRSITGPTSTTGAFEGKSLRSVSIPHGVTNIGRSAFEYNQLTDVTIPSSVTTIGRGAFTFNELTSIAIPSSVTTVGQFAFQFNEIATATFEGPVASIDSFALSTNPIDSIVYNGTTYTATPTIPNQCFERTGTSSLTITGYRQADVNLIKSSGIACLNRDIVVPSEIGGSPVETIASYALSTKRLKSVILPNTIKTLEYGALYRNDLIEIDIPSGVTSIEPYAFTDNDISVLPSYYSLPSVDTISIAAFSINKFTSLTIPDNITTIEDYAFATNQIIDLQIPANIVSIGDFAFSYSSIESIVVPESLTFLHERAFAYQYSRTDDIDDLSRKLFGGTPSDAWEALRAINLVTVYAGQNPNGLVDALSRSSWTRTDYTWDWGSVIPTGGYLLNPSQLTIHHQDASGNELAPSATHLGTDSSITNYKMLQFVDWSDPDNPVFNQTKLDALYRIGDELTLTPPPMPGYLTPSAKTITLSEPTNELTFVYHTPIVSVPFTNHQVVEQGQLLTNPNPPSDIHHPIITNSSLALDQDTSQCQTIEEANLLSPTSLVNRGAVVATDTDTNTIIGDGNIIDSNITILGGLDFTLTNCDNGGQADISYTLGQALTNPDQDLRIYKHNPEASDPNQQLQDITDLVSISTNPDTNHTAINYSLIDGGNLDQDQTVNGRIVDPVYVGMLSSAVDQPIESPQSDIAPEQFRTLAATGVNFQAVVAFVSILTTVAGLTLAYRGYIKG